MSKNRVLLGFILLWSAVGLIACLSGLLFVLAAMADEIFSKQSVPHYALGVLFTLPGLLLLGLGLRHFSKLTGEMWAHFEDDSCSWMPSYWTSSWENPTLITALRTALLKREGGEFWLFVVPISLTIVVGGIFLVWPFFMFAMSNLDEGTINGVSEYAGLVFFISCSFVVFGFAIYLAWFFLDAWRSELHHYNQYGDE